MSSFGRWSATGLAGLLALGIAGEVGLRAAGVLDFPIYTVNVDPEIGYLPEPSQHGAFINKNRWVFNDRSMPIQADWHDSPRGPDAASDVLVIGNSIVMGGNPYDQPTKLTPLLEDRLGDRFHVWPLAVGGWNKVNQMAFLATQPDVAAGAEWFVWQVMSDEFHASSRWGGQYVFPIDRPVSALLYATRRYVLPRWFDFGESELPARGVAEGRYLEAFDRAVGRLVAVTRDAPASPGLIYLFPTQEQLRRARRGEEWLPERAAVTAVAARHGVDVLDLATESAWLDGFYRDGIHPTVEGNRALADLLAQRIRRSAKPTP